VSHARRVADLSMSVMQDMGVLQEEIANAVTRTYLKIV